MTFWDDVELTDFKDDMSLIAETLGIDAAKKIIEICGGDSLYIPKAESVIRYVRDRRIYKDFKSGKDYRELAQKYGLTTRHIRVIVREQKSGDPKSGSIPKQIELF